MTTQFALTAAGVLTDTQEAIAADIIERLQVAFNNPNIEGGPSSIFGQFANIAGELRSQDQQVVVAVYRSFDPNSAIGTALDARRALTGSLRKGDTVSAVQGLLEFAGPGTVNDGDLFLNDNNSTQWQAIGGPYVDTGGPYPEFVAASLVAVDSGPILANAGTAWSLITQPANLTGFTNPTDDADPGRDEQLDPAFRVSSTQELFARNIGGRAAIKGIVSKVEGVEDIRVYHNPRTQPVDADGIPFKATNVVLETNPPVPGAALRQAIADAMFSAMGEGTFFYGTDFTETVIDIEDETHEDISFDLFVNVPTFVVITLDTTGTEQVVSSNLAAVVAAQVLETANTDFRKIGRNPKNMDFTGIVTALQESGEISGVVATTVQLSRVAIGGPFVNPVPIAIRERPTFESVGISVIVLP